MMEPEQLKADAAAVAKRRCPETGRDLSGLDANAIRAHADLTWPRAAQMSPTDRSDYMRRYRLVMQMADAVEKEGGK